MQVRIVMVFVGFCCSGSLALAQNSQVTEQELQAVAEGVEVQEEAIGALESNLDRAERPDESPVWIYEKNNEKCYAWQWEGGQDSVYGAGVQGDLCLRVHRDPNGRLESMRSEVAGRTGVNARVGKKEIELLRARVSATSPLVGTPSADAVVEVMGYQVWSESVAAPTLDWSDSYTLMHIDQSVPYTFMIGPFPARVVVGARGGGNVRVSAKLAIGNAQAVAIPQVDIVGYANGIVDTGLLTGGVQSISTLLADTMKIEGQVGLLFDPVAQPPQVLYAAAARGYNRLHALSGDVALAAKSRIAIPRLGKEFLFPLYRFPGYQANQELFNDQIGPRPVGE